MIQCGRLVFLEIFGKTVEMYLWGRRGCPRLVKTAFQEGAGDSALKRLCCPHPCVCVQTCISVCPKCVPSCLCTLRVFGGCKGGEIVCLVSEQQHDLTQWPRESQLQGIRPFLKHLDFLVFSPPLFKPKSTRFDNEFRWWGKMRSKQTTGWKIAIPLCSLHPGLGEAKTNCFFILVLPVCNPRNMS